MKSTLLRHCLLALLLIAPLQAEATWYKVEVIIFAHDNASALNEEFWDSEVAPPPLTGAVEMRSPSAGGKAPFTLLDPSKLSLGGAVQRLNASPHTHPLLHFGWYQPGLDKERAVAVHVHDDMGKINITLPDGNVAGYSLPVWQEEPTYGRLPTIEGTLRVILSRYLHVQANLLYTHTITREVPLAPTTVAAPTQAVTQPQTMQQSVTYRFNLKQSRRMRSNELHYIDHPMFGVLVKIVPLGT